MMGDGRGRRLEGQLVQNPRTLLWYEDGDRKKVVVEDEEPAPIIEQDPVILRRDKARAEWEAYRAWLGSTDLSLDERSPRERLSQFLATA